MPDLPPRAGRGLAQRVKTARGRKVSSQRWLKRQLNDPFVRAARAAGYRSRAAWKLRQIDDRYRVLRRDGRVVDLGAAPGGWTQVAVERCLAGKAAGEGVGRVVAVDHQVMDPVPGAIVMQLDFLDPSADAAIAAALGGPASAVLSDLSPPASGHRATDHLRSMALSEAALELAVKVLEVGGGFVAKILQGSDEKAFVHAVRARFRSVHYVKPSASRKDSSETYIVALGFRGPPPPGA
jgi:23S rRNA (uridine2552-2'-O)-methyltransferase